MNPLQSGTPASAITPQGYRNSSQSGSFQDGYTSSDLLESSSASYTLKIESPETKLTVTSGSNQVLGVSTTAQSSSTTVSSSTSGFSLFLPVMILLVSAVLAFYFYQKYRKFVDPLDSLEDK